MLYVHKILTIRAGRIMAPPRIGPIGVGLCSSSERALAGFFHELVVTPEVAEERQIPIAQIELDSRGVWRVSGRLLGKVHYPRLAPLEVYVPAALCRMHRIFVCYSGSSYRFSHKRSLPTAGELDPPTFVVTAFSEVQSRIMHRLPLRAARRAYKRA